MEPCIARARNRAFGSSPRKPAFPGSATGILPVQGDERYRSCSGMAKMAMAQRGARRIGRATGPERFGTRTGTPWRARTSRRSTIKSILLANFNRLRQAE